jgi:ferredoxin
MKKPVIDYDLCDGCATCVELCPEVFEMGDDEKAFVKAEDKCGPSDCEEAADTCPSEAITFVEE